MCLINLGCLDDTRTQANLPGHPDQNIPTWEGSASPVCFLLPGTSASPQWGVLVY